MPARQELLKELRIQLLCPKRHPNSNLGANLGKGGKDAEGDDASKIRMGTLNRGARKDTKTDGKAVADAEPGQAVTSLDSMKEAIQNITQSINPMGKIIQFIDDDIESMKREYDGWARMYANSQE